LNTLKMSDIAMDTPDASTTVGRPPRPARPDNYDGNRAKLESWILQFDRYFHLENDNFEENDKVIFATGFMKEDAERWVTPFLRKYMNDDITDAENTHLMESWDLFKVKLRQVFSAFNETLLAEQKIQLLRQTKSAAEYTTTFQQNAEHLQWDNNALMRMYKQGLKPAVRVELMRSGAAVTTLETLIAEAIRIDNELFELKLEERVYSSRLPRGNDNEGKKRPERNYKRHTPNEGRNRDAYRGPGHYRSNGYEPMHLNQTERERPKQYSNPAWDSRKGNDRKSGSRPHDGRETRSCYGCGKPGHLSKDCKSKNKMTRQLNVLTRYTPEPDSEDNEWEVVNHDIVQYTSDASIPAYAQGVIDALSKKNDIPEERLEALKRLNLHMAEGKVQFNTNEHLNTVPNPYESTHGTLVERPSTPHPGTRVPNVWEFLEHNNDKAEDEPLSLEKLAIDTPPASPGNVRKHPAAQQQWNDYVHPRVLRNMTQPQINQCFGWDTGKPKRKTKKHGPRIAYQPHATGDWVDQALAAYNEHQPIEEAPRTSRYLEDYRNPKHDLLSWTGCYHDNCGTHYTEKEGGGWYPQDTRRCKWQHFDCPKDTCHFHLYDKRITGNFPGMDEREEQRTKLLINGHCTNPLWQVCMMEQCKTHEAEKEANGFGTTTFLGTRLAPGIDPGAAMLLMPNTSSNSQ
jgi:hypothetical protein